MVKKDFEKSDTEIETYESIQETKFPQDFDDGGNNVLDDLNEKEMIDPRLKQCSNDLDEMYYLFPKKKIRAKDNIHHIFKPNFFLDVRDIYQDKASIDMTLDEIKYITNTCWNEKYQHLTIDMTKNAYEGRYGLGL